MNENRHAKQALRSGALRHTRVVDLTKEWGFKITLREMDGLEKERYEEHVLGADRTKRNIKGARALLVSLCAMDPDQPDRLLFDTPDEAARAPACGLEKLATECLKLNGMIEDDVEELVEGLPDAPRADSHTA